MTSYSQPKRPSHLARACARALTLILLVAIAAALAVLSLRFDVSIDLSHTGRNTLHQQSREIISLLTEPVTIVGFARNASPAARAIEQLAQRYRRYSDLIGLKRVDPDLEPMLSRSFQIQSAAEIWLTRGERRERVESIDEPALSSALMRLLDDTHPITAVLVGHGERSIEGDSRESLSAFFARARKLGHDIRPLRLADTRKVPPETKLLVLLPGRSAVLEHEQLAIQAFLASGGNLLWLQEPGQIKGLDSIQKSLGVEFLDGMLIDPTSQIQGRSTPEFIIVGEYASHALFKDFTSNTVFPGSAAIGWRKVGDWQAKGVASSAMRSWLERGDLEQSVRFDNAKDIPGPLDLMVVLERSRPTRQLEIVNSQRIIVCADTDFLSNAYLGLAANAELGERMLRWLTDSDGSIRIERIKPRDLDFSLSMRERAIVALAVPVGVPIALLLCAALAWRRRRI